MDTAIKSGSLVIALNGGKGHLFARLDRRGVLTLVESPQFATVFDVAYARALCDQMNRGTPCVVRDAAQYALELMARQAELRRLLALMPASVSGG